MAISLWGVIFLWSERILLLICMILQFTWRKDFLSHGTLSLENFADFHLCFRLVLLHSVFYFFFLYWSPSTSLRTVFYAILSNIDKVLSITPSANETLTSTIRTGSPVLVGSDTLGVLCYNFPISNDLIQIVKFPTKIPDCDCHSPTLLDFFLSSDASICCKIVFPPLGNSDHVIISVSIDFPSNLKGNSPILFHSLWLFSCWLGWSLWSLKRYFMVR